MCGCCLLTYCLLQLPSHDLIFQCHGSGPKQVSYRAPSSIFCPPSDHPLIIRIPNISKWNSVADKFAASTVWQDDPEASSAAVVKATDVSLQSRVLSCLGVGCAAKFSNNRMDRLRAHVFKKHRADYDALMTSIKQLYPPFKPKSTSFFFCVLCQIRGTGCGRKQAVHNATLKHLTKEFSSRKQAMLKRRERLAALRSS